ncbi:MAG: hypothetical protein QOE30_2832 [Mycobacterium sp.]|uniref:putative quinol monooxygenase n=1 Tax=Mycobacterium sp. TaxID=1785 RepID=UPI0028B2699F|nr:antibiotic biosynthesis monooxygenase [Mycobacterium sp.]MDT5117093.1 hypothetical protein [Mycobacterium sp.]
MLSIELQLVLHPEIIDEFLTGIAPQELPATRSFEGNDGLALYQDKADPRRVSLQMRWRTLEDFDRYLQWRTETGMIARIYQMSAKPPQWAIRNETLRL